MPGCKAQQAVPVEPRVSDKNMRRRNASRCLKEASKREVDRIEALVREVLPERFLLLQRNQSSPSSPALLMISGGFDSSDEAEERDRAYTNEEAQHVSEELHADKRFSAIRLEFNNLKEVRRDLESKIAKMQVSNRLVRLENLQCPHFNFCIQFLRKPVCSRAHFLPSSWLTCSAYSEKPGAGGML